MVTELPPPPAPIVERLEASFPLPAELALYEHLWAGEGETPREGGPARRFHGEEPENPVRLAFGGSAIANPIKLLLDRLGFFFHPLFRNTREGDVRPMPVTENSDGGGLGDGSDPVPPGDPIPVDGGGRPGG